jgi:hypothetical protein
VNFWLNDSLLPYNFTDIEGVNLTFYTIHCIFYRPNLANLPRYMLEDETELSPRLRTLALQNPVPVVNLSTEPLKVVVKKATVRKDLCTPEGLQVTLLKVIPIPYPHSCIMYKCLTTYGQILNPLLN